MKINLNNNKIKSLFFLSLVGAGLGKKEKSTNKSKISKTTYPSAISFDSLSNLPKIVANVSEGGNSTDQTLIFGGYPILMMHELDRETAKNCTISFFTLYTDSPGCGDNFPIGILTSSLCSPVADGETNVVRVFTRDKLLHLGDIRYMTFGENNKVNDFDYALADVFSTFTDQNRFLSYTSGLTNNDKTVSELYPVIGTYPSQPGIICAYGSSSGYHCGNLIGNDLELTIPSP